jgi:outer membrane immunogenic protein
MKRQLLATASSLAWVGVASAADLPIKAPPPPPAPVWSWTGFYIGINGGAVWHHTTFDISEATSASFSGTATGGTIGGTIGYNLQSGNVVFGIEADGNWVGGANVNVTDPGTLTPFNSDLSWLSTVRGRLGLTFSPTLLYITGGYAAGRIAIDGRQAGIYHDHETKSGWTLGGGFEYLFAPNWSVKLEGLYVDLGRSSANGNGGSYIGRFKDTAAIFRTGLNVHW